MRVVRDLIEADGIIDTREILALRALREKHGIRKDDEQRASAVTLADALKVLAETESDVKRELLADFQKIVMSDDFCARDEALLMLALRQMFTADAKSLPVSLISVPAPNFCFEASQLIYVESETDERANGQIVAQYREIENEMRLAGFNFVYLPMMAAHYRTLPEADLSYMAEFLYPNVSTERLQRVTASLRSLSTARFCKEQLAAKLGVKELEFVVPSLMIKTGTSIVNDVATDNFLLVEAGNDVLHTVRTLLDSFSETFATTHVSPLKPEKGRFIFKGIYKQIADILMLRKGIRSSVLIDPLREQISFPEAEVRLEKVHRREKAFYVLCLLESANGGINFTRPTEPELQELYRRRMAELQLKYAAVYRLFGGEEEKAPNLEVAENRMPMLSVLKRQIGKMGNVIAHINDYTVRRNAFGNYAVALAPEMCCIEEGEERPVTLRESELWKAVMK